MRIYFVCWAAIGGGRSERRARSRQVGLGAVDGAGRSAAQKQAGARWRGVPAAPHHGRVGWQAGRQALTSGVQTDGGAMFRVLARVFAGLGLAVLAADLVPVLRDGAPLRLGALGEWWAWAHRDSLLLLQPAIERHLSPALWDPGVQTLLEWPLAVEALVLAALAWALRRRRPRRPPPRPRDSLTFRRR